jgi:hypothetical protein
MVDGTPDWIARGKTIRQLIRELQSFEDQDLEVRLSVGDDDRAWPISLVAKVDGRCVLSYDGDVPPRKPGT